MGIVVLCLLLDRRVMLDQELRVDRLETNTYLGYDERPQTQVIAWKWDYSEKRHMVVGWAMQRRVEYNGNDYYVQWGCVRVLSKDHARTQTIEDREAENAKKFGRFHRDGRLQF